MRRFSLIDFEPDHEHDSQRVENAPSKRFRFSRDQRVTHRLASNFSLLHHRVRRYFTSRMPLSVGRIPSFLSAISHCIEVTASELSEKMESEKARFSRRFFTQFHSLMEPSVSGNDVKSSTILRCMKSSTQKRHFSRIFRSMDLCSPVSISRIYSDTMVLLFLILILELLIYQDESDRSFYFPSSDRKSQIF